MIFIQKRNNQVNGLNPIESPSLNQGGVTNISEQKNLNPSQVTNADTDLNQSIAKEREELFLFQLMKAITKFAQKQANGSETENQTLEFPF